MATAVLVVAGAGGWSWPLGGSVVRVAPLVVVAAVAGLLAGGRLSGRLAAGLLVVWLPASVWAAGAPAGQLLPQAWPSLVVRLGGGVGRLTALGSGPIGASQPWPRAAWLLGAGAVWVAGAVLAASGLSSVRRRAISFGVLAAPWIAAVVLGEVGARQTDPAAWQGAAVLLAGLLWATAGRVAVRPAVALGLVAALVSVATAQAVGPRTRWFTPGSLSGAASPFGILETEPTYTPLGRRSGATMLQISAAEPALWRMRVLTLFAGPGWRIGYPPELPQPAAEPVQVQVGVRGLRNALVVSPGHIDAVHADGNVSQAPGEAWQLTPPPRRGDTYRVRASVVRATAEQLRGAPAPTDVNLLAYTLLTPGYDRHSVAVPLFGQAPDPQVTAALDRTPYGPVAAVAHQLAAGARTQWEVVARVQRYLLDGDRFRYTTNVPQPEVYPTYPLVDFLLGDHAGYCQHFAGAAALLLRLAGVPTRVAVGFATGVRQRDGRFNVRDVDAHAWIEVYFQGYGWVAFNPTPPAAQAQIPHQLDLLAPATTGSGHGDRGGPAGLGWLALGAILVALAAAGIGVVRRRTRRGSAQLGQLLEALVHRTGGHVQPSSTLAELSVELARLVGPHTAALAVHAQRARFAPDTAASAPRPRPQIVRALARDLGPMRALLVLVAPAATRRPRHRPRRTAPRLRRGQQASETGQASATRPR